MSKSLRLPEKWFRRGLWLVAAAFAFFLIGLGSLVVGIYNDMPPFHISSALIGLAATAPRS